MAAESGASLARSVGPLGLFALAFGCIVGSGWVVVLGEWLGAAGPGGTVVGLAAGALIMLAVCAAYSELVAKIPFAGGDFEFARRVFGPRVAFNVGWFSTLFLVCVASFEGIALSMILGELWHSLRGPAIYSLFGVNVTIGDIAIGLGGVAVIGALNYRGVGTVARLQSWVTFSFIAIVLSIVVLAVVLSPAAHATQIFVPIRDQPWWRGSLWIYALAPFFLNGFQSVPQLAEERAANVNFRIVARTMYLAIICACLFYCSVVIAATVVGDWRALTSQKLPAAAAFAQVLPHQILSKALLVAAALSVLKTWNGIVLWASRLILAQARAEFIPSGFAKLHPRYLSPYRAVIAVAVGNVVGVSLGRGVLIPLLDMTSICVAFTMVLACAAALRLRRNASPAEQRYQAPGGQHTIYIGMAGSCVMAGYALLQPWIENPRTVPLEWMLIAGWAFAGVCYSWARNICALR